jgi:hypothetical protein
VLSQYNQISNKKSNVEKNFAHHRITASGCQGETWGYHGESVRKLVLAK